MSPSTNSKKLVLALNAGSSSFKASVIADGKDTTVSFLAERLLTKDSHILVNIKGHSNKVIELPKDESNTILSHGAALTKIIDYLEKNDNMLANLLAVGHRVVHGGTIFPESAIIEEKELLQLASISHLAPL
jgi:acetate kinase